MTLPSSNTADRDLSWRGMRPGLPVVVGISSTIALLVAVIPPGQPLITTLLISNGIGLVAWCIAVLIRYLSAGRVSIPAASVLASFPAMLAGLSLGGYLETGHALWWFQEPGHYWRAFASNALLVGAAVVFGVRTYTASSYRARMEAERARVAEARQGEALARLALLQAQIEPHFLFNTLANVQTLIEREPRSAARMLEHLNQYLRGALGRTRLSTSTCEQEIALIGALLAIAAIRLGPRLRYTLELPEALRAARLPPLLLQPLVETALAHGIEPAVGGGEICVKGSACEGRLVLRVSDTGLDSSAAAGLSLSHVRERLASLYGESGQLTLRRNEPRGTVAEISLPLTLEGS